MRHYSSCVSMPGSKLPTSFFRRVPHKRWTRLGVVLLFLHTPIFVHAQQITIVDNTVCNPASTSSDPVLLDAVSELRAFHQDSSQYANSVFREENCKPGLRTQEEYQNESKKGTKNSMLISNLLLTGEEGFKKSHFFMSVVIGLMVFLVLLLMVKRLRQLVYLQKEQIAAKEAQISQYEVHIESEEQEKAFRERLIHQQRQIIAKNIEDTEKLRIQLEILMHEQQQSQCQEMLWKSGPVRQDNLGIEALLIQFNTSHPLFSSVLLRKFPKLSQADIQFCTLVRMNLTTKEIALLLNIEPRSTYIKKYRIMEKMGLGENDHFEQLLFNIE